MFPRTGAHTVSRNQDWASDEKLFASAVDATPNSVRARVAYAQILSSKGDHLSASEHLDHVLHLKPDYLIVNLKLARTLQRGGHPAGHPERALNYFKNATRLRPAYVDA